MLSLSFVTAAIIAPALVAAQTVPFASPFQLSNPLQLDGKKCITPSGGNAVVGATLQISDCANTPAQKVTWSGTSVRSGGLCWTAKSGNATVSLATCNSSDGNQSWYYSKFGGRVIKHNPTGRCLDLAGSNVANGTPVQVQTCSGGAGRQIWNPYYELGSQPAKAAQNASTQYGTNQCGGGSSQSANCQNVYLNSLNDFCLWAPPARGTVGNEEARVVSWCVKAGRGTRLIPNGTLKGVHFVKTSTYIQISGVGDFTKMNIPGGDQGGELDPHGPTAAGNPVGGLVYGNPHGANVQYHEWASFISYNEFCIRACLGVDAAKDCQHIYDVMGCYWNQPANYDAGVFEQCLGDKTLPPGIYGTSTWHQGDKTTPPGHPPASSSQCQRQSTVSTGTLGSTSTTTTTTSQPSGTPTPGSKLIRSGTNSSKCLAVASSAQGAAVVLQTCSGAANQLWTRTGNTFRVYGNMCLDVKDGVNSNGAVMQIWSCGPGTYANQQWSYNDGGNKHITWIGRDKSVDVKDGNFAGSAVQIWQRSNGNVNQLWTY